jgi:uncharacterized membrane protein
MSIQGRSGFHNGYLYLLLVLIFSEALFFLYYGLSRHNNYLSSLNDLGHFDQAIWGFLEGFPFLNTDNSNRAVSRLGGHFDLILALFVPFYLILPSVNWLIIAQSLALPLASLPIYFLALTVTRSQRIALMWATIYLVSPFMVSAAFNDFHPVSLAAPFIALAYLSLEEGKRLKLFLSCVFVLLCKEHFGLLVMGFGLLWYLKHHELKTSFGLVLLGGSYFLLVMKVLIPSFSTLDEHSMIVGSTSRYGWLGQSLKDIFISVITNPVDIAHHVLFSMDGWLYLVLLFLPLMGLPLFGCTFLLPGMGDLLANLLSLNPMPRSIFSYHSVTLVPVLVVAAIYGSRRLDLFFRRIRIIKEPALIALVLVCSYLLLPGIYHFWAPQRFIAFHDENYKKIQGFIKPEMSLSVQANVGAHFTQRLEIYRYPNKVGDVDAVVLRLDSPTLRVNEKNRYKMGTLDNHLQMTTDEYLGSVEKLLENDMYQKRIWEDPWLIFMKGEQKENMDDDIMLKINHLKAKWK